ncbi:MAG: exodeoxyribonuclease large subunit [Pseudomonadota bacterium]|nr:exodeoxyribonuclease large subunit [Pseudomonadota bacterium]
MCIVDNSPVLEPLFDFKDESISVSQLNKLAKTLLENNMPIFWIKGEVSGLKIYNHAYFDLKDDAGKIACVIFAKTLALQTVKLDNGLQIEVRGRVTLYSQTGSYQINIERIRIVGLGELWESYQRLLNKLKIEGLFDASFKQSIPQFPKTVGVITSKDGSVVRDIITTLRRRAPSVKIIVYNTAVQGRDAGMQIAKTIKTANLRNEAEVLIVCRGGGNMQDLWCFNEEVVAREVFIGHIPLISAVGHETDTTIIDFVADLRAPTPTAAAEMVAKSHTEWIMMLRKLNHSLVQQINLILNNKQQQVDLCCSQLKLLNPFNQLGEKYSKVGAYSLRLRNGFKYVLKNKVQYLSHLGKQLGLLNPANILERGYAIVKNSSGDIVYTGKNLNNNEQIEIVFASDKINATVNIKTNS